MKKILTLLLAIIALVSIPLTVSAEKDKWKDEDYNFKKIKNVVIADISVVDPNRATYIADLGLTEELKTTLHSAFSKRNVKVYVPGELNNSSPKYSPCPKITIVVYGLGKYTERIKAYDEEETVDKKEVGKDEHGKDVVVTVPTKEIVHHPARDVWHAIADISFVVTDGSKQIYTVRDSRERSSEQDPSGMLGRICKDFAKDITK